MSRINPFIKISSIKEEKIIIPVDYNAKLVLDEENYKKFKSGESITNKYYKDIVDNYLNFNNLCKLKISFIMEDAPPEIANALQRACTTEVDGFALDIKYTDLYTDDPDMNRAELLNNINLIPLNYDIINDDNYDSIELNLNYKNITDTIVPITTKFLNIKSYKEKQSFFFQNINLIYLQPGKTIKLKNIKIKKGNTSDHIKFLTATNGCIWPLDRKPKDRTINTTPMKHEIKFNINCISADKTKHAERIIKAGCYNLISRFRNIHQIVLNDDKLYVTSLDNLYKLEIEETNSPAKAIERICYILFPDIEYITAELIYHTKIVTCTVKGVNSKKMLSDTLKECIRIYQIDNILYKSLL